MEASYGDEKSNKATEKIFMVKRMIGLIVALFLLCQDANAQQKIFVQQSKITFLSEAQLETISATSHELKGVVDPQNKTFAFSVTSKSFKGFNSPLQQEHFNDNYLESDKYPVITFTGKIIDEINFEKPGVYTVRAKGMLSMKGVSREQIIRAIVDVKSGQVTINSDFEVLLDDYSIRIPRVVSQKISPSIKVKMEALLKSKYK
ncbi:YceI family protein [soil metagenome]